MHSRASNARTLTRRSVLQAGAGGALLAASLDPFAGGARAATGGMGGRVPFGAAVESQIAAVDPAYQQQFLDYCDFIIPMNELKFSLIHPQPDTYNFEPADRMVDFAHEHGRQSRGQVHVWWGATPDWIEPMSSREAERALIEHIETVTDRYRGRLRGWDVVNEIIANDPQSEGPLRQTTWLKKLGPRHIPLAFSTTARTDPDARLAIADYELEFTGPRCDARRAVILQIVRKLLDRNVKVDAVGMQGHLYAEREIDKDALKTFHRELDKLGVSLLVTELDVINRYGSPDPEAQDEAAYRIVDDFLDGVFAWKAPELVVTWGLTDKYSWVGDVLGRPDGAPSRPLPLDASLKPKKWMELLRKRLA